MRKFISLIFLLSSTYSIVYAVTPLNLGTVTFVQNLTCPGAGVTPTGASCKQLEITNCKDTNGNNLDPSYVDVAITKTTVKSPALGTVILQAGGGGTGWFGTGDNSYDFPDEYLSLGYNVVQTSYDAALNGANGWQEGTSGVLYEACRPATLFQYLYSNTADHTSGTAFCGQGISGGGGTFAYALAHYANNISGHTTETQQYLFDYVLMASGPSVGRLDVACAPKQGNNNANVTNCQGTPYALTSYANNTLGTPVYSFVDPLPTGSGGFIDNWEGTSSCGVTPPNSSDFPIWQRDSIISSGTYAHTPVFQYGATNVSFYFCSDPNTNQSFGLGWFLTQKIKPLNGVSGTGLAPERCYPSTGGCSGEAVWGDTQAQTDTVNDMSQYCKLQNHT